MYGSKRVAVRELNPHILCALCGGYLIQATTVIECLHSFCRSCIVNFLETSKVCPICDAQIHKTRPLLNIRPDQTLQSLVYKLVPGLFQDEMRRRREFHATLSDSDLEDLSLEERGEASLEKEFKPGDDHISLVLQLAYRENRTLPFEIRDRRYLLCPSEVTVKHLKKFIKMKFQLNETHKIEMYRAKEKLSDDLMLQDIALIYSWRREKPMNICYVISESRGVKSKLLPKSSTLLNKQSGGCCDHNEPVDKSISVDPKLQKGSLHKKDIVSEPIVSKYDSNAKVKKCKNMSSMVNPTTVISTAIKPLTIPPSPILSPSLPAIKSEPSYSVNCDVRKTESISTDQCLLATSDTPSIHSPIKPPPMLSASTEQKTSAAINIVSPMIATAKVTPSSHDTSKLMHSVESILKKTPTLKRTNLKTNTSNLPLNQASETLAPPSVSVVKEKSDKTINKTPPSYQQILSEDKYLSNKSVVPIIVEPVGIKRSQSLIEAETEVCSKTHQPQKGAPREQSIKTNESIHEENVSDTYSSYIPKLQKHLKICAVKRSASYEGPSQTPVMRELTCVDAMEKRNWKKRKLSTIDYEVSRVTVPDKTTTNGSNITPAPIDKSKSAVNQETTVPLQKQPTLQQFTIQENASSNTTKSSVSAKPPANNPISSLPSESITSQFSSCSSNVLPQIQTNTVSPVKLQSKHSVPDARCKPPSRKTNIVVPTAVSLPTTKSNNKLDSGNIQKDYEKLKIDKIKIIKIESSKKKSRVLGSNCETTSTYVSSVSVGYIQNKSLNDKTVGKLFGVSAQDNAVEEICVDISSSSSDVSSVTSPTTYVTSPGTEDRTDGSALPDIQTSCDTNCVVAFPGKVLPLDLSVKKK